MLPILRNMCQATGLCCVAMRCIAEGNKATARREGEKETALLILFNPS